MDEANWLSTEKLVKLIEQSIEPDAIVEHDVELNDLTSGIGLKRQCDIVIKSGKQPREMLTIVEVQDRTSKMNVTFFDGLVQKMKDVGAQRLICVSTSGFPESIKDKAKQHGGTVKLVKLNKHSETIPAFANFNLIDSRPVHDSAGNANFKVNIKEKQGEHFQKHLNSGEFTVILSDKHDKEISVFELPNHYFGVVGHPTIDGVYKIEYPLNGIQILLKMGDQIYPVEKLTWDILVKNNDVATPLTAYSYEQEDIGDPLRWVLEGISTIDNISKMVRMVVRKVEGGYMINEVEVIVDSSKTQ